ncbi:hypothetical protein GQ42DRAFT_178603 [Ramicandelaber brevisporus]|nr:hypothetical protein GQ42DRAFT_178603 [Ramicandelaber brevisporus]
MDTGDSGSSSAMDPVSSEAPMSPLQSTEQQFGPNGDFNDQHQSVNHHGSDKVVYDEQDDAEDDEDDDDLFGGPATTATAAGEHTELDDQQRSSPPPQRSAASKNQKTSSRLNDMFGSESEGEDDDTAAAEGNARARDVFGDSADEDDDIHQQQLQRQQQQQHGSDMDIDEYGDETRQHAGEYEDDEPERMEVHFDPVSVKPTATLKAADDECYIMKLPHYIRTVPSKFDVVSYPDEVEQYEQAKFAAALDNEDGDDYGDGLARSPEAGRRRTGDSSGSGVKRGYDDFSGYPPEERERLELQSAREHIQHAIRWRQAPGRPVQESNAKLVKWSDGSMSLVIGDQVVDMFKAPITVGRAGERELVAGHHASAGLMQALGQPTHTLKFRPIVATAGSVAAAAAAAAKLTRAPSGLTPGGTQRPAGSPAPLGSPGSGAVAPSRPPIVLRPLTSLKLRSSAGAKQVSGSATSTATSMALGAEGTKSRARLIEEDMNPEEKLRILEKQANEREKLRARQEKQRQAQEERRSKQMTRGYGSYGDMEDDPYGRGGYDNEPYSDEDDDIGGAGGRRHSYQKAAPKRKSAPESRRSRGSRYDDQFVVDDDDDEDDEDDADFGSDGDDYSDRRRANDNGRYDDDEDEDEDEDLDEEELERQREARLSSIKRSDRQAYQERNATTSVNNGEQKEDDEDEDEDGPVARTTVSASKRRPVTGGALLDSDDD